MVLKFGLDKLMENEESTVFQDDFDQIFRIFEKPISHVKIAETAALEDEENRIYFYEGKDYAKERDCAAFEKLESSSPLVDDPIRKRKLASFDDIYQALELARIKHRQESELRRVAKKKDAWLNAGYVSTSRPEVDTFDGAETSTNLNFLRGSVVAPQVDNGRPVIIGHCVDNSGNWSHKGVFRTLSQLSESVENAYVLSKEMEDLHVGDAHLVEVPDSDARKARPPNSATTSKLFVCLLVVQKRTRNQVSGILFEHLKTSLGKLAAKAHELGASVHLSRIGQSTPDFDWYSTERIIKNALCSRGIDTFVYYFSRGSHRPNVVSAPPVADITSVNAPAFADVFKDCYFSFYSDNARFLTKQDSYLTEHSACYTILKFLNYREEILKEFKWRIYFSSYSEGRTSNAITVDIYKSVSLYTFPHETVFTCLQRRCLCRERVRGNDHNGTGRIRLNLKGGIKYSVLKMTTDCEKSNLFSNA